MPVGVTPTSHVDKHPKDKNQREINLAAARLFVEEKPEPGPPAHRYHRNTIESRAVFHLGESKVDRSRAK